MPAADHEQRTREAKDALGRFCAALRGRFGARVRDLRLFGSFARGDHHEESDVDVLVVIADMQERERREIFDVAEEEFFVSLVRIMPLALSDKEYDELVRRERLIAKEIAADGVAL